jgi:hypothetical protein
MKVRVIAPGSELEGQVVEASPWRVPNYYSLTVPGEEPARQRIAYVKELEFIHE